MFMTELSHHKTKTKLEIWAESNRLSIEQATEFYYIVYKTIDIYVY